jgi:exonuclease SbcC
MRPVLLEMAGFGSFREPTTVDFTDAEYFALVGPTGSGKSTVIDAMTFALYGSVPRWDDRRAVALALAPTVNRGTVRLVFDVGGTRYVVARELRRAASGGVSVRGARLERLRDRSGLGGVDEETESVAGGAGPVTKAVEELLGLPFGDFCTCVVLPQGDFAEFLHTEPRKRQEKLVRILGLGVYDGIAREANSEAAAQRQRADVLTEQLAAYADATPEAEQAAAARVAELAALADRVGTAVPELGAAAAALRSAEELVARWRGEREQLAALAVPDGLADLDERRRAGAAAQVAAAQRAAAAEVADTAARERLAAAPARGPLEQVRRDHAELAAMTAELPGARERHEKAEATYATAASDATDARTAVDEARAGRDTAQAALGAARDALRRLTAERDGLLSLRIPTGLDALDRRRAAAAAEIDRAETALADAETADTRARAALAAAPARDPLEQARRDRRDLDEAEGRHRVAVQEQAAAERAVAAAGSRVAEARHRLDHAQEQHAQALRADVAATLRPTLVAGDACPVCAQTVATLPAPLPAGDLRGRERAAAVAERAHDEARREEATATAAQVGAAGEVDRLAATIERLRSALTGVLSAAVATTDEIGTALAALDRLGQDAERAAAAVRAARRARDRAAAAMEDVRGEAGAATAALRSARDPLVPFGAPAVDGPAGDGDVLAGWTALVDWAHAQAAVRDEAVPSARNAAAGAERDREAAEQALAAAERAAADRRRDETAAARAEQESRGALEAVQGRAAALRSALAGAPTDAEVGADLARLDALEGAVRTADAELRNARAALRSTERAAAQVGREVTASWEALRTARDPLVPLGAPAAAGDDLLAAWNALIDWARREATARTERVAAAAAEARAAQEARDAVERRIAEDLATHDVAAALPLTGTALPAVAAVLERSRGARERIAERRAGAGRIAADRDEAESAQQVARMLGNLLRSDAFPRWLVASALDALVADASTSLAELSGGQFELTHSGGEFLVIDHADADARRPVKTLSGGETFQASLALALALSAQMSGLAARGAARLESIFLDEGFGTLDEANLEVVAGTLENLATRGDRMVGVITHVPALAERVPVRFAVSRDQRTSSIVRENL